MVSETLGCSFHTYHDRVANQFFHLGHFVIQSLQLFISSALRSPNHLCEGDDGGKVRCEMQQLLRLKNSFIVIVLKQTPI